MSGEKQETAAMRTTRRREALLAVLERADAPMTAEAIYHACLCRTSLNLSTVYRALAFLVQKGTLRKTLHQDGRSYYEINNHLHGHHLVCYLCHRAIPIEGCPLEELGRALSRKTGFIITGHTLEFTGICPECAARQADEADGKQ